MRARNKSLAVPAALMFGLWVAVSASAQTVRIEGSAAGYGMSRAAAAAFGGERAIQAGVSGTALGFANLCAGKAHLVQSSRPIQKNGQDACRRAEIEFVEIPIALDALGVIVHPRNMLVRNISLGELRMAWELKAQGRVTRWSHINPAWPETPMQLIGPDRHSDEARFLTAAVLGGGYARQNYMSSAEDAVVVRAVARDSAMLGIVSLAYFLENRARLKAVPVVFETGTLPYRLRRRRWHRVRTVPLHAPYFFTQASRRWAGRRFRNSQSSTSKTLHALQGSRTTYRSPATFTKKRSAICAAAARARCGKARCRSTSRSRRCKRNIRAAELPALAFASALRFSLCSCLVRAFAQA